jgi:hypothetical protein
VVSTPLKNISQIGSSSQLLGKIKFMFQTTNQFFLEELGHFESLKPPPPHLLVLFEDLQNRSASAKRLECHGDFRRISGVSTYKPTYHIYP